MPGTPSTPNPNPLAIRGPLWFDVRNYGARPGVDGNSQAIDNTAAFQRAVDAAKAAVTACLTADSGRLPHAVVFVPASAATYCLSGPVYVDGSYITIKGEGFSSKVAMLGQHGYPAFIFGMNRVTSINPDATYRPDLFGKLDTSFAPGAGQKWGVRFRGDSYIVSPASALSHGGTSTEFPTYDKWFETRRFTIEFAVEGFSSGQLPSGVWLFGQGSTTKPTPIVVRTTGTNTFAVSIGTQLTRWGAVTSNDFTFTSGATGVQKITLQVDCIAGTVKAAVNRTQVAVTGTLPANSHPNENLCNQFTFNNPGDIPVGPYLDWSLLGFGVAIAPRYTFSGAGQAIARIDAGSMTDAYSYGTADANTLAAFLFTEDPATAPRHLALWGPQSVSQAFSSAFLVNTDAVGLSANYCGIEDVEVAGAGYGYAVALYYVLEFQINRVRATGAIYGIGDIPLVANYRVLLDDVLVNGGDAGLYFNRAVVEANRVDFGACARSAVQLIGCVATITNVFGTSAGNPAYTFLSYFVGGYGGQVTLTRVNLDNEDAPFLYALLYLEREATGMSVSLEDILLPGKGNNIPTIKLSGASGGGGMAWIDADLIGSANTGPLVEDDSMAWSGTVRNAHGDHSPHLNNLNVSGLSKVTVIESHRNVFDRHGRWYAGNSRWEVPCPADGQYEEFRVAATGTFGSATPPKFKGLNAIQASDTASLSAYAIDHTAIAATLSGQASDFGQLTEYASIQIALMLFGNQAITVPSTWYLGLATYGAYPGTQFTNEPSGVGYTRGTLANSSGGFTAASSGSKASAASVTFGTATGTYTAGSVFLSDAPSGGNIWAMVNLATPLAVGVGDTPTISSGALTFTHTPLPGNFGTLTDFGWGKVFDLLFRNTAFTVPATWYAALSTVAVSKATTTLTELSGGSYARVALANNTTNFASLPASGGTDLIQYQRRGDSTNGTAIVFPTPSGSQGTAIAWALSDAASVGNTWVVAPLVNSVAPNTGTGAPTFAVGSLTVGC